MKNKSLFLIKNIMKKYNLFFCIRKIIYQHKPSSEKLFLN